MAKVKKKDLEEGVADLLGDLLGLELVLPDEKGDLVGHRVFTGATYDIKNRVVRVRLRDELKELGVKFEIIDSLIPTGKPMGLSDNPE